MFSSVTLGRKIPGIEKILIFLLIFEMFLGGGGRVFAIGSLSIRQVFFSLIILLFVLGFFLHKSFIGINGATIIIYLMLLSFLVSILTGLFNGNNLNIIWADISPLLFFLMFFPFYSFFVIKGNSTLPILKVLKFCGFILSLITIMIFVSTKTGFYQTVYTFLSDNFGMEFVFRPTGEVFYKGHPFVMSCLFLCYASLLKRQGKYNFLISILCFISIIASGTRGLIYVTIFGLAIISVVYWRGLMIYLIKFLWLVIPLVIFLLLKLKESVSIDRIAISSLYDDPGVLLRLNFVEEVKLILNNNPIFGGGFGTEITDRSVHLEISFLDILMEQGLFGATLWFIFIAYIFFLFYKLIKLKVFRENPIIVSLFASYCALLVLTNTNPFINNPIGISFLIIVIVILRQNINEQERIKNKELQEKVS